ncbi:MAG: hypothetical protein JWN37_806 [Candidatus Nomurabacteria bacterium]|nr:hypothetical protein [Candidatus Nomurabacteria bacterium]
MTIREVFTNRFIKDLFWSIVFIFFLYAITHNPITHPTPQPIPGNWSIQIMQHPLFFGFAGHNYIALKDADGNIISEFHGLATDINNGGWKYIGTNSTDIIKVWEFENGRYYIAGKGFPGKILSQGLEADMRAAWNKGRACMAPIDSKKIPYPAYGVSLRGETVNSNSVAYTLAICMGFSPAHVGLLTPGEKVNLLK